ncbi:response regulator transcription factor [Paenibacillus methanolicus]|uniref:Helix-turn-helix protein n=1 Tax=Paenibacillus methanolicus TaxID=582686 RepID=A0A5S5CCZ7_9BACL|nr:response regulator [Paenibacillus methanolicus]TYP76382.1 helix-turn-helix protein [Paenibacillus methanolicus]
MLKLLMVDDEKWVRDRFAERIPWSEAGFAFMGAASGAEEAIRWIEREEPHLLLTDITMPNMNGLELAAYVRKRWPRIRIIILTAYGEFEYARQAIELKVDHYLIKLAQTPEIILDACRKVAETIEQEMGVHQKLEMQRTLEREKTWSLKRDWTERLLREPPEAGLSAPPAEWFDGAGTAGSWASFMIGWHAEAGAHAEVARESESWMQLGRRIGEALESLLASDAAVAGCRSLALPIGHDRIWLLIGSDRPWHGLHANQVATKAIAAVPAGWRGFAFVGVMREVCRKPLSAAQLAALLREGLEGAAGYFYHPGSPIVAKRTPALQRLDAEKGRERIAAAVRALTREQAEDFQGVVFAMTQLGDPPIHPSDLLRMTRQMLNPELVPLPGLVTSRLEEIDRLASWSDYCRWWTDTAEAVTAWFAGRKKPPVPTRKEIRYMLSYIHEHFKEDVQLTELAKHVHMHPSYAGQMFKQEVGENFSDYVNRVRMDKAGELLERTAMKIYEVSGAVGITDYRYFCKLFKSYAGVTPTQYKHRLT